MLSDVNRSLDSEDRVDNDDANSRGSSWFLVLKNVFDWPGAGTLAGALACFLAAFISVAVANGHTWVAEVPLMFTIVLLFAALLFGAWAGVLGTVLSALVFATHLFTPMGKLRVASDVARSNLGWMLMIGIAFSFLFAPQKTTLRRQ